MESKHVFFEAHLASADGDSVFARIVYKFRYAQTLAAWLFFSISRFPGMGDISG